jgi:hypothetical protein
MEPLKAEEYQQEHLFHGFSKKNQLAALTINDVLCDSTLLGTACLDTANPLVDLDFFKDP